MSLARVIRDLGIDHCLLGHRVGAEKDAEFFDRFLRAHAAFGTRLLEQGFDLAVLFKDVLRKGLAGGELLKLAACLFALFVCGRRRNGGGDAVEKCHGSLL
jgi:hypothetical protein